MWILCGCHAIDKQFVFIFSNLLFIFFLDERKFSFVIYVAIVSRKRVSRSTRRTEDQSLGGRYADEKFHKTEKESWISNDLNSFVFRTLSLFFFFFVLRQSPHRFLWRKRFQEFAGDSPSQRYRMTSLNS